MRTKDWSASPLGPAGTWPESIKTAVSICLSSRFPILLWAGPELRMLYNDAYIPFLGETKHPAALGEAGRDVWQEIWPAIGPMHAEVAAGRATSVEDFEFFFQRRRPREEVYVTFSYSPIFSTDGRTVDGVFCACIETTEKVVGARRLLTLRDLGKRSSERRTVEAACREAVRIMQENPIDIPFAAIYLCDDQGERARRMATVRLADDAAAFPEHYAIRNGGSWPFPQAVETRRVVQVDDLPGTVGVFPSGPWPDPVETAFVLPLRAPTQARPAGALIAGASPRRVIDSGYTTFFDLVAGHIATSIADARAYQEERKRAEALAEIDRAKTSFFSNVSHEFRTPLTLMMSPIEEVLAESSDRLALAHRTLLGVAHRNSLRLLRLVNSLLDFSRVEAGRIQASYEPVDLATVTAALASNFHAACERAGLALEVRCPSLGQAVHVDREMWEKIVLNLLSNAFKFTLQGRIEVAVHADEEAHAVLVVSDSGVGIPEAELPRIFERFHRVEGQQGRTHEGTGIGLALVQELVRLHGGEIRVESEVGHGTTFVVRLPFGRDQLPPERVHAPRSLASTAIGAEAFVEEALRWLPSSDAPGLAEAVVGDLRPHAVGDAIDCARARVLVVDDNADMREHLRRLVSKWWDVEAASDGQTALDAARRSKPDLIIADVMMPRLDGIGLLSALRSDPDLLDVPVILLSARAGDEAREEGLRAGADDYLVKPFSARELVARVRSNLSLARLRADDLASMTRLHELSTRLTARSDLPSSLQEVLDAIMELQGADFGDVQLYDEAMGTLRIVAHRGLDQKFLDHFESVDASDTSACGLALRAGARIIIEDVNTHPDFEPHRGIATSTGFRGVQSTPLFDRHTGKPVGMLSTLFRAPHRPSARELRLTDLYARQAADVIAFRLAERRLRESEERFRTLANVIPAFAWITDADGNVNYFNDRWYAYTGQTPEQALSYGSLAAVHPDDVERMLANWQEATRRGVLCENEFRCRRQDGAYRWYMARIEPRRDKAGRITGWFGASTDVHDRKLAEAALRESQARLQAAVRLVGLGLYAWDPRTNAIEWDARVKAIWGLPADAPVDYDTWRASVHPHDVARAEAAIQRCVDPQGDGSYDVEYRVIGHNDGVERWVATRGQTHFEAGRPVSFYGVAIDVTGRKHLESTLERRVEERTRELASANRQLRSQIEQREMAEAAVEQLQRIDVIGQITSGVAHDFNNLLSVMLTNTRLLGRKLRDPDDQESLGLIRTAAERGAKLTAQLLAFSRKQRLEPQAVDLNRQIVGISDLLGVTLGGSVTLDTILAPDLWPALVDPTQLELIILNLTINGRDAMGMGGTLTIATFNAVIEDEPSKPEAPPPGDYVALAVTDTGVGIPDEVLLRVFEPFFTTKEPGKGSGLGLAQVFGFAKQSDGGVRIETRVGEGTSVTVFLPRVGSTVDEPEADWLASEQAPPTQRQLRVLVVDDDPVVFISILRMLDQLGYATLAAGNGEEALRSVACNPPVDLVLTDFAMPGMNGIELARAIRAERPGLPIIFVTGFGDLEALREFGDAPILQKPYAEGDLSAAIGAALNHLGP